MVSGGHSTLGPCISQCQRQVEISIPYFHRYLQVFHDLLP